MVDSTFQLSAVGKPEIIYVDAGLSLVTPSTRFLVTLYLCHRLASDARYLVVGSHVISKLPLGGVFGHWVLQLLNA